MSDNSQTIVDLEATSAQAKQLAKVVLDHLVNSGIVLKKKTDCTLGDSQGHEPGPKCAAATTGRKAADADRETNGLAVVVERAVFGTGENGIELKCAACKQVFEPGEEYINAIETWYEGDDDVEFACPKCRKSFRLVEWDGPWAFAMGNLGFTFWNWPELSPAFVKEIAGLLGHPVRVVRQHL